MQTNRIATINAINITDSGTVHKQIVHNLILCMYNYILQPSGAFVCWIQIRIAVVRLFKLIGGENEIATKCDCVCVRASIYCSLSLFFEAFGDFFSSLQVFFPLCSLCRFIRAHVKLLQHQKAAANYTIYTLHIYYLYTKCISMFGIWQRKRKAGTAPVARWAAMRFLNNLMFYLNSKNWLKNSSVEFGLLRI